jgi:Kef-type K+ transport system membrane component KefB
MMHGGNGLCPAFRKGIIVESHLIAQLFLILALIVAAAQFAGAAARSIGQPRVFGELLAGVILGPTLLDILHWGILDDPELLSHTVEQLAELGVLFLMFTVGLEVHLKELLSVGKVALWAGVLGAALPTALGLPAVAIFDHPFESALYAGVVLSATSVSISAQTLLELGVLRTKEGMGLLATAVVDDVLAILLLSVVIATMGPNTTSSAGDVVWILVKMALYLGGSLAVAWFVLPRLFHRLYRTRQLSSGTASFALVAALLFGWSAEVWGGVAAITGAFIAGVGLSQTNPKVKAEIENAMRSLSYTFLVPVFFINVGLHADLTQLSASALPMTALLVVVAVVSKIAGSGIGARLGGFSNDESFRLGVCMISRGEVGLIIASLGLSNGLLETDLFQPLFVVILLSTVLTPPLVRLVFRGRTNGSAPQRSAAGAD